jgi:hypothetical protein
VQPLDQGLVGNINGLNAIEFVGTSSSGPWEGFSASKIGADWSPASASGGASGSYDDGVLFILMRVNGNGQNTNGLGLGQGGHFYGWGNQVWYWDIAAPSGSTAEYRLQSSVAGTNLLIAEYSKSKSSRSIWKNGAEVANTSGSLNSLGISKFKFPSYDVWNDNRYYNISVGEMLYYRGNLSDSLRQAIEGYLAHKWGLQASLDSSHPFKAKAVDDLIKVFWKDKSRYKNHAIIHGSPMVMKSAQNGLSVLSYDSNQSDYHEWEDISNIRTVFSVLERNNSQTTYGGILADDDKYHFFADSNAILHSTYAHNDVKNGLFRLNGSTLDGKNTAFPDSNFSIVTIRTNGNVEASRIGKDRFMGSGYHFDGKYAELLIYDTPLSDSEIERVEGYLAHKWGLASSLAPNHSFKMESNTSLGEEFIFANGLKMESSRFDFFSHEKVFKNDDLLSRWRFDELEERSGGVLAWDVGPAGNHGFFMGDASLSSGKFGMGLSLDGNGDYFEIPHFRGLFEDSNFTLSAWIKLNEIGVDNDQQDAAIFATNGSGGNNLLFWYNVNSTGIANRSYSFNLGSPNNYLNRLNAPDSLAIKGVWQHLAVSVNGDFQFIYFNGNEVVNTDFAGVGEANLEGNTLRIGSWNDNSKMDFSGILDEVRIYNSALSSDDISVLYGEGIGDLGVTPEISVDARNSDNNISVVLSFSQFGQNVPVSDFNESDIQITGGILDTFKPSGTSYEFGIIPTLHPSRIQVKLNSGAANYGVLKSSPVSMEFSHHSAITAYDDLTLWYAFEEQGDSNVALDFSTSSIDGVLSNVTRLPGKFGQSIKLGGNSSVLADAESLSLSSSFTLSLWAKVLNSRQGVLARCGQFYLQYFDDNSIRGGVYTSGSWKVAESDVLSGSWTNYAITYDNSEIKFYINGKILDSLPATNYLNWGDGDDKNFYIGTYGTSGWNAKADVDEVRVYRRALIESEISSLYGSGTGDVGIRPIIFGESPFANNLSPQSVKFLDGNSTIFISGLDQSEVNATGARLDNYDNNSSEYTYDLNVTSPPIVRVALPYGVVEKDGNLSQAVSFEFHKRPITSVEDGLLAWYDLDELSDLNIEDKSGRLRHATVNLLDATDNDQSKITGSTDHLSPYSIYNAFDKDSTTTEGRWLAERNMTAIPTVDIEIQYDFENPTIIGSYQIISQHINTETRSPKSWTLHGSNDKINWPELHRVTEQTGWNEWEVRNYSIPVPSAFQYYKIKFDEATGADRYFAIAEINFFLSPSVLPGRFGNALDFNELVHLQLPFRVDQGSFSRGLSFSAWVNPDEVFGGDNNERQIFSSDNGGWDWSMSIRYGALTVWNGYYRSQSGFQLHPGNWYHVVSVFDPLMGRTILFMNGKSVTLDSLGPDNSSSLITVGWQNDGRTFDGLIDDIRIWSRPLGANELLSLWGDGMGDIGPQFDLLVDSPVYGSEIHATAIFNQPISDFNASEDLNLVGLTLKSSSSDFDSNKSTYDLVFEPTSLSDGILSVSLKSDSVTGKFGGKNIDFNRTINFRPHRVKESDLILWWELNEGIGTIVNDSSLSGKSGSFQGDWGDANESKFGESHIVFDNTNNKSVLLSSGLDSDFADCSMSFWINPVSENFYLFNMNGVSPELSISLRNQRPLFHLSGLNQQSLPGTATEEFWANGYVELNNWSHLVFTYSLENRRARFYIDGLFEGETNFASNQSFPLKKSFRLGPKDGNQSLVTHGKLDDFRIYSAELTETEVAKLYGAGSGDFYTRSIDLEYEPELEIPKVITINFSEDGVPVKLDNFNISDLSVTNGSLSNLNPKSDGVYTVEISPSPDDFNGSLDMNLTINGSSLSTYRFGKSFSDFSEVIPYRVDPPMILSPPLSHWSVGEYSEFYFRTENGLILSESGKPSWLDFNSSTGLLSGTPENNSTDSTFNLFVQNPHSNISQIHKINVINKNQYSARLELDPVGVNSGESPQNFTGLILHLDASTISELSGTRIYSWTDLSGSGHSLDRSRGEPIIVDSNLSGGSKVVSFDGLSQLYSNFDFSSSVTNYSILAVVRYSGSSMGSVLSSVGTEWVFGLGAGSASYWKMGNVVMPGASADNSWHLYAGTFSSDGTAIMWRDLVKADHKKTDVSTDSLPKYFAVGGSGTNDNFSTAEVAEVLFYDRVLVGSEIDNLQSYLHTKWLGGSVENFPLLVHLSGNQIPGFDIDTFSDPLTGGDLRFFDNKNRELIYEIDEWNSSGESLVWVKVPQLNSETKLFAFWGNDANATLPSSSTDGSLWQDFEGVWHFSADGSDSTPFTRNTNNEGNIGSAFIGNGISLDGSNHLTVNNYSGISGNSSRSISMWIKTEAEQGGFVSWGDVANRWDFGWNGDGPFVKVDNIVKEQGMFTLNDDSWHHIAVSFPSSADLNQSMLFVDGKIVDAPNLSSSKLVNTNVSSDLLIGASHNGSDESNGTFDEVRISSVDHGSAWFMYSFLSQKENASFLSPKLEYLSAPVLGNDLNVTVMKDDLISFIVESNPPATLFRLINPPSGVVINSATGEITGVSGWVGDETFTVEASNAKGSVVGSLTVHSLESKSLPIITNGGVIEIAGREATILGNVIKTGASTCSVKLYYGKSDGNQSISNWDRSIDLGNKYEGSISHNLAGLNSGETYYYRFYADNANFSSWSEVGSFSTLSFDQGILRFHTGLNEKGDGAGLFWDKNGSGEIKVKDANLSSENYNAPDGSSWLLTKAIFNFDSDLYLGPNLENVVLEGVNALSIISDGNVSIDKNLYGAIRFSDSEAHVLGGTILDGHDVHYGDDPLKGLRLGQSYLGGFGGAQGPR